MQVLVSLNTYNVQALFFVLLNTPERKDNLFSFTDGRLDSRKFLAQGTAPTEGQSFSVPCGLIADLFKVSPLNSTILVATAHPLDGPKVPREGWESEDCWGVSPPRSGPPPLVCLVTSLSFSGGVLGPGAVLPSE